MSDAAPKVTIVIPTFNRSGVLLEALDSVYAQTWKDVGVVVYKKLFCQPSSVIVRTAVAERVGGFDETLRRSEDRDFSVRMARQGPILGIPEALALMRLHGAANPKDAADDLPYDTVRAAEQRIIRKMLAGDPSLHSIARRIY